MKKPKFAEDFKEGVIAWIIILSAISGGIFLGMMIDKAICHYDCNEFVATQYAENPEIAQCIKEIRGIGSEEEVLQYPFPEELKIAIPID